MSKRRNDKRFIRNLIKAGFAGLGVGFAITLLFFTGGAWPEWLATLFIYTIGSLLQLATWIVDLRGCTGVGCFGFSIPLSWAFYFLAGIIVYSAYCHIKKLKKRRK